MRLKVRVGDNIVCVSQHRPELRGLRGRVVQIDRNECLRYLGGDHRTFSIEFVTPIKGGHNCGSTTKEGHGCWLTPKDIKVDNVSMMLREILGLP